jgi:ribonuclease J
MSIESSSNVVVSGPDIVSRGFVYVKESDELIDEARGIVIELMDKFYERQISDWNKIRSAIRDELGDLFWKKTKRRPIILPILMEV